MMEYYNRRAAEYDDTVNRGATEEASRLRTVLNALPPCRVLDVACGTGAFTRSLSGDVVALDQSENMLTRARLRVPSAAFVRGDALRLPFKNDAFDRVITSHFYGHLHLPERDAFLAEAHRVASELILVEAPPGHTAHAGGWEQRKLSDGGSFRVYTRYFEPRQLADELGGSVVFEGEWFVAVRARGPSIG
jgi:demethylmenaquinone methyltransferase/2-methoxy-6-polyprenyl-1,4-benzoquinol methylase